mmetsp:Transcript_1008/g.2501  ORF Transcript_1008/g.2501 Transcript_1008/m.2501 type:complete len:202 (+) Transcript_1008:222-827(+)
MKYLTKLLGTGNALSMLTSLGPKIATATMRVISLAGRRGRNVLVPAIVSKALQHGCRRQYPAAQRIYAGVNARLAGARTAVAPGDETNQAAAAVAALQEKRAARVALAGVAGAVPGGAHHAGEDLAGVDSLAVGAAHEADRRAPQLARRTAARSDSAPAEDSERLATRQRAGRLTSDANVQGVKVGVHRAIEQQQTGVVGF